tara:strand:- start:14704 stop:15624 length:921 start_codon:yes stop_codon:yes gene_type:complete
MYKKAGVDIAKGDQIANFIKRKINPSISTGFNGTIPINPTQSIVGSTDGVGTKLKLAFRENKHDTIGIDLVAMSVNDVICSGATPIGFFDYIASSDTRVDIVKDILFGIQSGCDISNCKLLGGETAEMPGFYEKNEYDLAGFAIGLIETESIIDGSKTTEGDLIVGIPSSGIHSNGYSLVTDLPYQSEFLTPTRIYTKEVELLKKYNAKSLAHITGGGFQNIYRGIPDEFTALIDSSSWQVPDVFRLIQNSKNIDTQEMYRIFNMGIGMVCIIHPDDLEQLIYDGVFADMKIIGRIIKGVNNVLIY